MDDTETMNPLGMPFILPGEVSAETEAKEEWSQIHAIGIAILMTLVGLIVGYVLAKEMNFRDELAARAIEVDAGPFVQTALVTRSGNERVIHELGETLPYAYATMYGKISGFLKDVLVDKGQKVKKGQLLATIQSPETVSQYNSAVADAKNKTINSRRMLALSRENAVSDEERDQAVAQADMAVAKVEQLSALEGYTAVVAPFDGTITARFADPGALVQDAANGQSGALPIVTVTQTDRLRITTYIDQRDAPYVHVGDPVLITLQEKRGVEYEARITRMAGELDTRSRTMLTEIEYQNTDEQLVTGGFVDIQIRVKTPSDLQIPAQALVLRGTDAYASVVSPDGTVHYRALKVGDNDGNFVTVFSGLEEGDTVVLNMGNSLLEGRHVQVDNG